MSEYIEFYVRKDEMYLPIGIYNRVDTRYQAFEDFVPHYNGLAPITEKTLDEARYEAKHRIIEAKDGLKRITEEKADILKANNSLEDKMDYLSGYYDVEEEYNDEIKEWTTALNFVNSLYGIIDKYSLSEYRGFNADKYLYAGIEPEIRKDNTEITEEDRKNIEDE